MMIETTCVVRILMLRTRNDQPSLWESVLPEVCLRLPVELERVDAWLDDERFFAPFRRTSTPDGRVPHPTTLMKITTRCGEVTVLELNEALLAKAVEAQVVKTGKVRADTTVVSAIIEYPTDSGTRSR
jgi:IS5 family transposase